MTRTKIRLVRPPRGLPSLAQHAPRVEAVAERIAHSISGRLRPVLSLAYNLRRRLATGGVILLTAWLFVHVMFGANGMIVYRQKKTEYQSLQKEIDHLQKENDSYNKRIQDLKTDPRTIEKEAREQLHYARPGEVVYVSPAPPPASAPATNAARK